MLSLPIEAARKIWIEYPEIPYDISTAIFNYAAFCDYKDESLAARIHIDELDGSFFENFSDLLKDAEKYCIIGNEKQYDIIEISELKKAIKIGFDEAERD